MPLKPNTALKRPLPQLCPPKFSVGGFCPPHRLVAQVFTIILRFFSFFQPLFVPVSFLVLACIRMDFFLNLLLITDDVSCSHLTAKPD